MVEKTTLARPYAKAILALAKVDGQYEKWSFSLGILAEMVQDPKASALLQDKTVSKKDIVNFVLRVCDPYLDDTACGLVKVLAKARRLTLLPEIACVYQDLRQEAEGTLSVELKVATALSVEQQQIFQKGFEQQLKRHIHLKCTVDKTLLGGFWAKTGNYILDGSVKGYLHQLEKTIGDHYGIKSIRN